MNYFRLICCIAFCSIWASRVLGEEPSPLIHDVESERKPWTQDKFRNSDSGFRFAIVADVTGGERKGVFPAAIQKLNLLQPEFVMSVGDFIKGFTTDKAELNKQWDSFDATVNKLDMPFFYISGNHDITNKVMDDLWIERYGRSYYYFVYRDVLFLCLNTQQADGYVFTRPGRYISKKQVSWARDVLKKYPKVKWTFVFMHQPLWVYNQSKETGFNELEQALKGRDYTVFAGHLHAYAKYVRNNQQYFMLATTGGTNKMRSVELGEFDHVMWVTMTDKGPVIANLLIDSIRDGDVRTEKMKTRQQREAYFLKSVQFLPVNGRGQCQIKISNPFDVPLQYDLTWEKKNWQITPEKLKGVVKPKKTLKKLFTISKADDAVEQIPECTIKFSNSEGLNKQKKLSAKVIVRQLFSPVFRAERTKTSPKIDGKLDDSIWQNSKTYSRFRASQNTDKVSAKTETLVAYDRDNLYVAFKCHEPNRSKVKADVKMHDGPVWKDDSVELFLDTNQDKETYAHLIVNSLGTIYDENTHDKAFELNPVVKTAWNDGIWVTEIAIPWKNLKVSPPEPGNKWGIAFIRTRTQSKEIQQLPYLYGENHQPKMFGTLQFIEK